MRIGLVSDVHWMTEPPMSSNGWHGAGAEFRSVLNRLAQAMHIFVDQRVDVIALAGDLSHHGDEESLIAVLAWCTGVGVPVLVVSGNHDVVGDPGRFERAIWRADARGVALASLHGEIIGGVRVAGVYVGDTDGWFGASLAALPETEAWGDHPVVLISHYPVLSLATQVSDQGFPYPGDLLDRQSLEDMLSDREAPTVVVGGHVHARASRAEHKVLQLTGGALVEPPYECAVIDVVAEPDGSLAVERSCRRLLPAADGREPVLAPEREGWHHSAEAGWTPVAVRPEELVVS
jgi:predicted phosphodiesterase